MATVQGHLPLLVQYIDIPSLMPFLQSRNLVTADEYLQLSKEWDDGHRKASVGKMIAILQRKCPQWEKSFLEAIQDSVASGNCDFHAGHEYILEALQQQVIAQNDEAKHVTAAASEYCDCGCVQCTQKIQVLMQENELLRKKLKAAQDNLETSELQTHHAYPLCTYFIQILYISVITIMHICSQHASSLYTLMELFMAWIPRTPAYYIKLIVLIFLYFLLHFFHMCESPIHIHY